MLRDRVYRTEYRKLQISLSDRLPFISLTCSLSHSELDIFSPEQNKGPRFDFFFFFPFLSFSQLSRNKAELRGGKGAFIPSG